MSNAEELPPPDDVDIDDLDPSTDEEKAHARTLGWKTEADWDDARAEAEGRVKPLNWMTAREFIAKTENSAPMMRERLRAQGKMIEDLNSKITDLHNMGMEQRRLTKASVADAWRRGRADAQAEMDEAAVEGDMDKYNAAKEQVKAYDDQAGAVLESTREPPKKEPPKPEDEPPESDPTTDRWVGENEWFTSSSKLNNAMLYEHADIRKKYPNFTILQQLEAAKKIVMRRYPEDFGNNARRDAPGAVLPSGGDPPQRRGAFAELPQEAKDAYHRHAKMFKLRGVDYTQKEYMEEYGYG
jgi:hypothetical protein